MRANILVAASALCVVLGVVGMPLPAAGNVQDRVSPPSLSEQKPVLRILEETYRAQLADSDAGAKSRLAVELRKKANEFHKDPIGRYVYLDKALRLSVEATDLEAALQVIVDLEREFIIDGASLRIESVSEVANKSTKDEADAVVEHVLDLVDELISLNDIGSAEKIIRAGQALDISEPLTKNRWKAAKWHVDTRIRVDRARERLRSNPDSISALGTLGRYLCLVKRDYQQGLHMLARSSDRALRRLAMADLEGPTEPEEQRALGDQWLALAQTLNAMLERNGASARAVYWYEMALPALEGTAAGDAAAAGIEEALSLGTAPGAGSVVSPDNLQAGDAKPASHRRSAKKNNPEATVYSGHWSISGDEVVGQDKDPGQNTAALAFGDPSWENYDAVLEVKAEATAGEARTNPGGPALRVHVGDRGNWCQIGLSSSYAGVTKRVNGAWSSIRGSRGFLEFDRWYEVKLVVRGQNVGVYVDGTHLLSFTTEPHERGQLGLQCQNSVIKCRRIRVHDADGTTLWEGLPRVK